MAGKQFLHLADRYARLYAQWIHAPWMRKASVTELEKQIEALRRDIEKLGNRFDERFLALEVQIVSFAGKVDQMYAQDKSNTCTESCSRKTMPERWVVVFSQGGRGKRQTVQVSVIARTRSAARKLGIKAAADLGSTWVASAPSVARKESS